jgi:transposase
MRSSGESGVEVILGKPRRRWSREDKAAIVAESCEPGATVSSVARRYSLSHTQLFAWRRELRIAASFTKQAEVTPPAGFAPVAIAPPAAAAPASAPAACVPAIEIDLPRIARVRMTGAVDAGLAVAVLAALVKR